MRILKLRFQNLNSLRGEWEIDFRHAAYADDGIFAITGSTGAGKSTILDAICLALYGATPRLGEITQSKNDLMSRHTGECLSEVIFSTKSGSFRCTWLQKRARKHPDGNLQSPTHEIAPYCNDDETLAPIETQSRKTKKLVAEYTGMDFDRFTRAMLLAQGSFAAFLQANIDDRSNLLEEITGTEIYGDISKKVHEFKSHSESELKSLTDRLSGMTVLTDDEEQALTLQKSELIAIVNRTKADIIQVEADKVWRQNLNFYNHQVTELEQEKRQLAEQEQVLAPQKHQLQRALKALEIAGEIEKLHYQRDLLTTQLTELQSYQQQLPTADDHCQIAEKNQTAAQAKAEQAHSQWQQSQSLFNQVRELDTTLKQKNQQAQEMNAQLAQLALQLSHNAQIIRQHEQQLITSDAERKQLIYAQQQIPHADTLPQTLISLTQLQENSQELTRQLQDLSAEQQRLRAEHQQNEQHANSLLAQLTQLDRQLAAQRQVVDAQTAQLAQLSQGQSIGALRQQIESVWQAQTHLSSMQSDVQTWQFNLQNAAQTQQQLRDLQTQAKQLAQHIQHCQQQQQSAKQTVDLLNRNLILLAKIQDLTQERDKLRQGEPCPLCGSIEHPFVTHQPYAPDQSEHELLIAKQQLSDIDYQLQQLLLQQNTLHSNSQQLHANLQQLQTHNQTLANQLQLTSTQLTHVQSVSHALQALLPVTSYPDDVVNNALASLANTLDTEQISHQQILLNLQTSLEQIETLQTQQQQSQNQFAKLNDTHNAVWQQQTLLTTTQEHRLARINEIDSQRQVITDKQDHLANRITQLLAPFATAERVFAFHPSENFDDTLSQHLQTLQQLAQHYHGLENQLNNVNDAIMVTQQTLNKLTTEQHILSQNQIQLSERQQAIAQEIRKHQAQRHSLFGEQDVETAAQALIQAKNDALQAYQTSQKSFHEIRNHKEILLKQIASLAASTTQLQSAQTKLQAEIAARFVKLGFADEADYQAAVLIDTERERLQQLVNQHHDSQQRNHNLLTQAKREQQTLLDNTRTAFTAEQLSQQLQQLQQNLSEQQKQLGAVEQQLTSNAAVKRNQQQLLNAINEQRRHTDEWRALHSLIGSNDGKKFRNFAQGLTFNIMIAHANEQLKKMSDRYLLLADPEQPLMLNVMDNYQGGQIRTSKNLSGGESFIISLSLALGLSNMASHRMQVDSLFLDEGFGTLDEEALDVALDTLTNLQQSGKLIGVISHIQALKDRISSKIEVVPQTGGISKIVGAGITRLS